MGLDYQPGTPSQANPYDFSLDGSAQLAEDWFRQPRLGHLEEVALLAPDVPGEQAAQPLEQRCGWSGAQLRDEIFHLAMLRDQEGHQGELTEGSFDGREQDLLFDLEVVHQFQLVAIDGAPRELGHVRRRGVLAQRAARQHAHGEGVVVLVRERDQVGVAQHIPACYYSENELERRRRRLAATDTGSNAAPDEGEIGRASGRVRV